MTLRNGIKIYIAIVRGWMGWQRRYFYIHTQSNDVIQKGGKKAESLGWKTLYVSIIRRTHQARVFLVLKKEIFAYFQTMRTLESFFFYRRLFNTTHAQILLSLRYKIILLYLNLATINLHKMVKRKIPLITSSVTATHKKIVQSRITPHKNEI